MSLDFSELRKYRDSLAALKKCRNTRSYIKANFIDQRNFHKFWFNDKVKVLYHYNIDDYQGTIYNVYEFNQNFFLQGIQYGTCDHCDSIYACYDLTGNLDKKMLFQTLIEFENDIHLITKDNYKEQIRYIPPDVRNVINQKFSL